MKSLILALTALLFTVNVNASGFETVSMDEQLALVHFNTNSSMLDHAAKQALGKLKVTDMSEVIIVGKTDKRASAEYNVALGLRRAKSVSTFIGANSKLVSVSSSGEQDASEDKVSNMRVDRVALVKVITPRITLNPVFGDANMNLQGPTSHLQYNTVPLGQGSNRVTQPRM